MPLMAIGVFCYSQRDAYALDGHLSFLLKELYHIQQSNYRRDAYPCQATANGFCLTCEAHDSGCRAEIFACSMGAR